MSEITKIFIGNLPHGTKPAELKHVFENYGVVVECDVMNRCGFVHMSTYDMADSAITALNGSDFRGQQIVVEEGKPKDRGMAMMRGGRGGGMGSMRGIGRGGGSGRNNDDGGNIGSGMGGRGGRGGFQQRNGNRGRGGAGHSDGGARGNFNNRGRGGFPVAGSSGPIRSPNFKKNRSAPYPQGGNFAPNEYQEAGDYAPAVQHQPKFDSFQRQGGAGNGGGGGGNFNNRASTQNNYTTAGNSYSKFGDSDASFQSRGNYPPRGGASSGGGIGSGSGGGGGAGSSGKFTRGRLNNVSGTQGQDRRGFALPPQQHQTPPSQNYSSNISNEADDYPFAQQRSGNNGHRSDVPNVRGNGRGSFRGNRGGFNSRGGGGGFKDGRGGGGVGGYVRGNNRETFSSESSNQGFQNNFTGSRGGFGGGDRGGDRGGSTFKRGGSNGPFNSQNNYQTEFPPLRGSDSFRGGRGAGTGQFPRQNAMTNRRFN